MRIFFTSYFTCVAFFMMCWGKFTSSSDASDAILFCRRCLKSQSFFIISLASTCVTKFRNAPFVPSILFYIKAHQSSPSWASFLLSREWQFSPSRSVPLISSCCYHDNSMCYIKTRSLCFAICSAWHHYHPAQPLTEAFLWVSPIPGLFCPPTVAFCSFCVQSGFVLAREQRAKRDSSSATLR